MSQNNIASLTTLANEHLASGEANQARIIYNQIRELEPANPDSWLMAGAISGELGLIDESISFIQKAITLDPEFAEAHLTLATLLQRESKPDEALKEVIAALKIDDEYPEAWLLRCGLEGSLELYEESIKSANKTIEYDSKCIDAYINLGNAHKALENPEEAIKQFSQALTLDPDNIAANICITESYAHLGQIDKAKHYCDKVEKLAPDENSLIHIRAKILQRQGNDEEAFNLLLPLIETDSLNPSAVITLARASTRLNKEDIAISVINKILDDSTTPGKHTMSILELVLGRLYDSLKKYDTAFEHFEKGNNPKRGKFDPTKHQLKIERIIDFFNPNDIPTLPRSTNSSEIPVFIVGMPRSGTTLVEQILCSHPEIFGAGELTEIEHVIRNLQLVDGVATEQSLNDGAQQYLDFIGSKSGNNYKRVTDKLPGNIYYLGMINLLFPNARVIHCMRSPLDTCLSCYTQNFRGHEYTHDLSHLGFVYREYEKCMEHWHSVLSIPIYDIHYEDIVDDKEKHSRELIDFCGLEWHDDCLEFYKNKRTVNTASYDQVSQPIYTKSLERWRNYEEHLGPLIESLGL